MNEDALLRALVECTEGETDLSFFRALVQGLSNALRTHGAWIREYLLTRGAESARQLWIPGGIKERSLLPVPYGPDPSGTDPPLHPVNVTLQKCHPNRMMCGGCGLKTKTPASRG